MNQRQITGNHKHFPAGLICLLWIGCILLGSPISLQIVVAQESRPSWVVAEADAGLAPSPVARQTSQVTPPLKAQANSTESASTEPASTEPASTGTASTESASTESASTGTSVVSEQPAEKTAATGVTSEISTTAELDELATRSSSLKAAQPNKTNPDEVRNLSVEPGMRPLLPADRPAWVGAPPDLSSHQHFLYVGSIPVSNEAEAEAALDESLVAAVHTYVDDEVTQRVGSAQDMPIEVDYIRKNLIDDSSGYMAELTTSEGPMYQKWVTVRITPEQREQFRAWHKQAVQRERLAPLGTVLFLLIGAVGLTHVVLRRWHGPLNLPAVNHQTVVEPLPAMASSGGSLTWLWVTFLCILVLPALMLLWFVGGTRQMETTGRVSSGPVVVKHLAPLPITGPAPALAPKLPSGSRIQIESGHGSRAIIIRD